MRIQVENRFEWNPRKLNVGMWKSMITLLAGKGILLNTLIQCIILIYNL